MRAPLGKTEVYRVLDLQSHNLVEEDGTRANDETS